MIFLKLIAQFLIKENNLGFERRVVLVERRELEKWFGPDKKWSRFFRMFWYLGFFIRKIEHTGLFNPKDHWFGPG